MQRLVAESSSSPGCRGALSFTFLLSEASGMTAKKGSAAPCLSGFNLQFGKQQKLCD